MTASVYPGSVTDILTLLGIRATGLVDSQGNPISPWSPLAVRLDQKAIATPVAPTCTPSNTGGVLTAAASPYEYVVFAQNANGQTTLPSPTTQVSIASGTTGSVVITGTVPPNAVGIVVCGRTIGGELQIGQAQILAGSNSAPGSTYTFTDTGLTSPSGALPLVNLTNALPVFQAAQFDYADDSLATIPGAIYLPQQVVPVSGTPSTLTFTLPSFLVGATLVPTIADLPFLILRVANASGVSITGCAVTMGDTPALDTSLVYATPTLAIATAANGNIILPLTKGLLSGASVTLTLSGAATNGGTVTVRPVFTRGPIALPTSYYGNTTAGGIALTSTTSPVRLAAGISGLRICVLSAAAGNTHATANTWFDLLNGNDTTKPLDGGPCAAINGGWKATYPEQHPLRCSVGADLYGVTSVAATVLAGVRWKYELA